MKKIKRTLVYFVVMRVESNQLAIRQKILISLKPLSRNKMYYQEIVFS